LIPSLLARAILFRQHPVEINHSALSIEPAISEKLRKLHGVLRRLAADRGAWAPCPARAAVPFQYREPMFDLR
jgi:hypothetical protein